jgi:type III restriction enzyme
VFGKIPRRSIAIPTVIDNYSPDFMYVVQKKDGSKELNVVIETKDVKGESALRRTEEIKIECAELFFKQLQIGDFRIQFKTQIKNEDIKKIVEELMK